MDESNEFYQPPESHEHHVRGMLIALVVFFTVLVVAVVLIVVNAQNIAQRLPFSAEKQFVRPYEQLANRWFQKKAESKTGTEVEIEQYLQALTDRLADSMSVPHDISLKVHYLDSELQNAFATLGGHIFVTRGLLEMMPNENSLAMVVAHEIAHIKSRDPLASLGRGVAIQMIYGFVTGQYSSGGDLVGFGSDTSMLFFSRKQESAADIDAVIALNTQYGHVLGYDYFFKNIADLEPENTTKMPAWLSSHPDTLARIAALKSYTSKQNWSSADATPIPFDLEKL